MIIVGKIAFFITHLWKKSISRYLNHKYNSKIKRLADDITFLGISKVSSPEHIEAGNNIHIGDNAYIAAEGGLVIGDNVHISRNMVLYTHNHNYEGVALPYDNTYRFNKVVIEKNAWIGMNVVILPGSHIGEGSIIGAGSVVAGKVDKHSIIGATLGTEIKQRNVAHYDKLNSEGKFGGPSGVPLK